MPAMCSRTRGRPRAWLGNVDWRRAIRLSQMHVDFYASGTAGGIANAVAEVKQAIAILEAAQDQAGLARAWRLLMGLYGTSGQYDRAGEAAQQVVDYATRSGETRLIGSGVVNFSICALHGPTRVADALARCEELLPGVRGDRKAEAVVLSVLGVLHAMTGELERGRELAMQSREKVLELGLSVTGASMSIESTRVELLAGDPSAAAEDLRRDFETLDAMGETYFRSSLAGLSGTSFPRWIDMTRPNAS